MAVVTAHKSGLPVVLKCASSSCGLRYPSPQNDSRFGVCPFCEAPAATVMTYDEAHAPSPAVAAGRALRIALVLDNLRSAMNVGTILRTADGLGLEHVYLCGYTADAANPKVSKTALGAEMSVPTSHHHDATECVSALQEDGWRIWALECTPTSGPVAQALPVSGKLALIAGNEVAGVDPALLASADRHVHLPMGGTKISLNVAVAASMAAGLIQAEAGRSLPT